MARTQGTPGLDTPAPFVFVESLNADPGIDAEALAIACGSLPNSVWGNTTPYCMALPPCLYEGDEHCVGYGKSVTGAHIGIHADKTQS